MSRRVKSQVSIWSWRDNSNGRGQVTIAELIDIVARLSCIIVGIEIEDDELIKFLVIDNGLEAGVSDFCQW